MAKNTLTINSISQTGSVAPYSLVAKPGGEVLLAGIASAPFTGAISDAVADGTYNVCIRDANGLESPTQSVTVQTCSASGNNPPTIVGGQDLADQVATVGVPIVPIETSQKFTDSDGTIVSYSAPGLPASLTINSSTGQISGTADAAGTYSVVVMATDNGGATVACPFNFVVSGANNNAPTIVAGEDLPTQTSSEGSPIVPVETSQKFTDSDGTIVSYSAPGLPASLTINSSTGQISGTADVGASANSPYSVVVTVTDDDGATVDCPFDWVIEAAALCATPVVVLGSFSGDTSPNQNGHEPPAATDTIFTTDPRGAAGAFGAGTTAPGGDWCVHIHKTRIYTGSVKVLLDKVQNGHVDLTISLMRDPNNGDGTSTTFGDLEYIPVDPGTCTLFNDNTQLPESGANIVTGEGMPTNSGCEGGGNANRSIHAEFSNLNCGDCYYVCVWRPSGSDSYTLSFEGTPECPCS